MPLEDKHRTKAECNERFAASLDVTDPVHESWAAIAVFYSALHYVESYFARVNVTCNKHDDREREIKNDLGLRRVYSAYKFLFAISITARYKLDGLPAGAYSQASIHLIKVKTQIAASIAEIASRTLSVASSTAPSRRTVFEPEPPRPKPGMPKR